MEPFDFNEEMQRCLRLLCEVRNYIADGEPVRADRLLESVWRELDRCRQLELEEKHAPSREGG